MHQVAVDDSGRGKRFFAYHAYYDYNSRAFRNHTEVAYERTMAQGKLPAVGISPCILLHSTFGPQYIPFQTLHRVPLVGEHVTLKTFGAYLDTGRCRGDVSPHSAWETL
jgi:hypothetical protein